MYGLASCTCTDPEDVWIGSWSWPSFPHERNYFSMGSSLLSLSNVSLTDGMMQAMCSCLPSCCSVNLRLLYCIDEVSSVDSPRAISVCGCLNNVDFCEGMNVGISYPPSRWCHLCLVDKWDNYCQCVTKHLTSGISSERLATINIPIVNALSFDSAKPPRIILMDLPNSF